MNFLGIDLGGTSVKYSLINEEGIISEHGNFLTKSKNADELLQKIIKVANEYKEKFNIQGVGISCPGVIHPEEGKALWANLNMPDGWHKVEIKKILEREILLPIAVDNDVNCAAIGEKWLGAGQEYDNFICIAIGTGIGSGIIINGQLYYGAGFQAGEIGYIHANKGTTIYWEKHASTLSLVQRVKDSLKSTQEYSHDTLNAIDGKWIFEQKNNIYIKFIIEDWADHLASGIADVVSILNPQAVVLGGGISAQGEYLLELIEPRIKSYLPSGFTTNIKIATTGNDAGKLGAVRLLMDRNK